MNLSNVSNFAKLFIQVLFFSSGGLSQQQRIDEIMRRITDIRKVYSECKSSVTSMEKKKKKIRKRDREYKSFLLLNEANL